MDLVKERKNLLESFLKTGLNTDEELHYFIRVYLGLNIPRKSFCAGHGAPFDMVSDLFFERVRSALGFGSRTSGKTSSIAALNFTDMAFRSGVDITTAGATLDQANKGYDYFTGHCRSEPGAYVVAGEPKISETKFNNGSKLEIVTGTVKGFNCYSEDTEVLTDKGWMLFADLQGDEQIFALNPETIVPEWVGYNTKFEYDYAGKMIHFFSKKDDILVTPNHRMLIGSYDRDTWKLEEASEVIKRKRFLFCRKNNWVGKDKKTIRVDDLRIPFDVYVEFMAWFLSEGCVHKTRPTIAIGQSCDINPEKYEDICDVIRELQTHIDTRQKKVTYEDTFIAIRHAKLAVYLRQFGKAHEKFIPPEIKNASRETIWRFLLTYGRGDGWTGDRGPYSKNRLEFYTASDRMAADLCELIIKAGYFPSFSKKDVGKNSKSIKGKPANFLHPTWVIRVLTGQSSSYGGPHGLDFEKVDYEGKVYCVNLNKHHVLLTRRNGKCTWQGQSPHPIRSRIDEVDLLEWKVLQQGLSMSASKSHLPYRAQDVFTSTRKSSTGTMQRLLNEAEQRNIKVYKFCIWESLERCNRDCKGDKVHGDCPAWDVCQGKAHSTNGWYKIDDFISKVELLDRDMFETEWENKKPRGSYLVYPTFNEATHEVEPFDIPYNEWQIVGAIDFGANFGFSLWAIDPSTGIWFGFFEYFENRPQLLEHHVSRICAAPAFRRSIPIYAGTRGIDKQPFIEFKKKYKLNVVEAEQDILVGINEVKVLLEKKRRFVYPNGREVDMPKMVLFRGRMPVTKGEFESYGWETKSDGLPDYETPQNEGDHMMATCRYAAMTHPRRAHGYTFRKVRGVR